MFFLLKCICMINHSGCGYRRVRIDTQAQTIAGDEEVGQLDRYLHSIQFEQHLPVFLRLSDTSRLRALPFDQETHTETTQSLGLGSIYGMPKAGATLSVIAPTLHPLPRRLSRRILVWDRDGCVFCYSL